MKHHSGNDYVRAAKANGLPVRHGKGDHVVVDGPAGRGCMTVPLKKELATGTECKIAKWFKSLGIVLATFALVVMLGALAYYGG